MKTIYVNIKGGLGNQMFQIATGWAYAKRHNAQFKIHKRIPHNKVQGESVLKYIDNGFFCVNSTDEEIFEHAMIYTEPHFHYSEIPELDSDIVVIDGYFQSVKYFEEYQEEIKNLFKFPQSIIDTCEYILNDVFSKFNIDEVVHIRRGDYKGLQHIHPVLPDKYYFENASKDALVVTDDFTDCSRSGIFDYFQYTTGTTNELEDLYMLTKTSRLVLANSSFSWWGAFLGNHKVCVWPELWFGPEGPQDTQDIYLQRKQDYITKP